MYRKYLMTMKEYNTIYGYICVPLCVAGISLNLLNIIVWARQRRRTSLVIILTALSVADFFEVFSYFLFVVDFFLVYTPTIKHHHSLIGMWMALIGFHIYILSASWSSWIVVTLAIFRHIKLTRQDNARKCCTKLRAKISVCIVFTIIFMLISPNFFFYTVEEVHPYANHTDYWLKKTYFAKSSKVYQKFLMWFFGTVMGLLPCILLLGLTGSMLVAVSRMRRRNEEDIGTENRRKTTMLLVVLLFFLLAMLPIGIYAFLIAIDTSHRIQFFYFLTNLTVCNIIDLLTVINSTSNFFVYLYFSEDFRRGLRHLCRCDINQYTPIEGSTVAVSSQTAQVVLTNDPFFN